jgi:hypothetical protein
MIGGKTVEVAALRLRLWEAGYRPVAVYSYDAPVEKPGKRPVGNGWQDRARRDPPAATIEPVSAIAVNTGILCDGLRAVDLDIEDAQVAAELCCRAARAFGPAPIRRRPNSARCLLLYRARSGEPRKLVLEGTAGKIEVLGRGQQFVAFGMHPSGAALAWQPHGIDAIPRDSLVAVAEDALRGFLREAAGLTGAPTPNRRPPSGGSAGANPLPNTHSLGPIVRLVASASEGERNDLAFWAACRAGEMVGAGLLNAATALACIVEAARRAGLPDAEAVATVRSGIRAGLGARHA